jgi:hypothetical protein
LRQVVRPQFSLRLCIFPRARCSTVEVCLFVEKKHTAHLSFCASMQKDKWAVEGGRSARDYRCYCVITSLIIFFSMFSSVVPCAEGYLRRALEFSSFSWDSWASAQRVLFFVVVFVGGFLILIFFSNVT